MNFRLSDFFFFYRPAKIDRRRRPTAIRNAVKALVVVTAIVAATVFLYVLFSRRAISKPPAASNDRGNQLLASKKDTPYVHPQQPRSPNNASRLEDRALKDPHRTSNEFPITGTIGQDGGGGGVRRPGPPTSRNEVVPPPPIAGDDGEFTGQNQIPANHKYGNGVPIGHGNDENKTTSKTVIRYGGSVLDYRQIKDVLLRTVGPILAELR